MSRPTQGTANSISSYVYGTFTPYGLSFQKNSTSRIYHISQPYNPICAETPMVWAIPRSIATTKGITIVFFSSAYLDVSVQRVRLPYNGITQSPVSGCPIRKSAD